MVKANLLHIRERIEKVCAKTGRKPGDILLVAVCKTFPMSANLDAMNAAQYDFGENKLQELIRKRSYLYLSGDRKSKWHMIGHLQTNKAKQAVINADMFHCLDSIKLAEKLNEACIQLGKDFKVLIQINSSGEESKSGIKPGELNLFLKELKHFEKLRILGLMSIGSFNEDQEDSRAEFRFMKELFDLAKKHNGYNIDIKNLSMGMSNDFEVAIEEGANIIRLGTAIFGARDK
ncbi:TPA: YggS family pyridoxal phosphate-dependent enzyme [Candidatus Delongbacteria bacterium]|nr:MAG: YggS family pyridoxal phosphate enzyme [Candidatus Delongbacteria bacterium GWF2_40_14]HAQ61688.1 YggS family pyridoxal phosphate-dependent enzyme [Candidatus Delongbacteria bacterium]